MKTIVTVYDVEICTESTRKLITLLIVCFAQTQLYSLTDGL